MPPANGQLLRQPTSYDGRLGHDIYALIRQLIAVLFIQAPLGLSTTKHVGLDAFIKLKKTQQRTKYTFSQRGTVVDARRLNFVTTGDGVHI